MNKQPYAPAGRRIRECGGPALGGGQQDDAGQDQRRPEQSPLQFPFAQQDAAHHHRDQHAHLARRRDIDNRREGQRVEHENVGERIEHCDGKHAKPMPAPMAGDHFLPPCSNRREQDGAGDARCVIEQQRRHEHARHGIGIPDGIAADEPAGSEAEQDGGGHMPAAALETAGQKQHTDDDGHRADANLRAHASRPR